MSAGIYVRIGVGGARIFPSPRAPELGAPVRQVIFVDLDRWGDVGDVRDVAHRIPSSRPTLVVRSRDLPLDEVRQLVERLGTTGGAAVIRHRLGQAPLIELDEVAGALETDPVRFARRLRAIELEALLENGQAIWRPTGYHYRLPSGFHSGTFVRLGDAISEPRDAEVLAMWLMQDAAAEAGLILDTASLGPVASALDALLGRGGERLGPTVVMEHYPRTALDVEAAVRRASTSGHVLGALSVNATGRIRDRLYEVFNSLEGFVTDWALHILVDQAPLQEIEHVDVWTPLPGQTPLLTTDPLENECPRCAPPNTTPVVSIDPRTFRGLLPIQVKRLRPAVSDAATNRLFWDACYLASAIRVEELAEAAVQELRPRQLRMGVRIDLGRLLRREEFGIAVAQWLTSQDLEDADTVLVAQHDFERAGFNQFWETVKSAFGDRAEVHPFPVTGAWPEELVDVVRGARHPIVLALGSVTGASLQRALVQVQATKQDPDYDLRAVIVHARPANDAEWRSLGNSYAGRVTPIWLTYLPEESPLSEEFRVLDYIRQEGLDEDVKAFLENRRLLCSGQKGPDEIPLFWGADMAARLTPRSIFGEGLDAVTTYAAVGAAMQRSRTQHNREVVPEWRVFDLPFIARSYYDPLILSSLLRWLQPGEGWWGEGAGDSEALVEEILSRALDPNHRRILVCELALAAGIGKVPREAVRPIIEHLNVIRREQPGPDLEVASALLEQSL